MKKHDSSETTRILKETQPTTKKFRAQLLDLKLGESIEFEQSEWPFRSGIAEYLYTMHRVRRSYSYRSLPPMYDSLDPKAKLKKFVIIRRTQ